MNLLDIFESDFARDKWNKASDEREAAANRREAEMTARHRQGKEDMSGAIDRLEKHMNTPVNEKLKGLPKKLGSARDLGKSVKKFRAARGLEEGAMKEWLWKEAERLERNDFIANAAEYGMSDEEAAEWWDSINGMDESGIGQDIVNRTEKMARATPPTPAGKVASTVKNAAKWLAGKGGPGKEGPTYESTDPLRQKLGNIINKSFGKIYNYGDDGLDYLDRAAPTWFDLFGDDQYNNDIDTIIAQAPIDLLKISAQELTDVLSDLKSGMVEGAGDIADRGEYDREGDMAKDNIHTIVRNARELESVIGDDDNLPEWVQDKLANIKGMMTAVSEYMQTQHEREGVVPEGTETQWSKESDWKAIPKSKSGRPVDPRGEVTHLSDVARRQAERKAQAQKKSSKEVAEHGGGIGPKQHWQDLMPEGFQDFNKVEPYAVCLAGKPVKKFDYYEEARRFHDNWKQKLYREGDMAKAEKITLMPLNLDEMDKSQQPPSRHGDYPIGAKGTTVKPTTPKKVVKDLTKVFDKAFDTKEVKEAGDRVDPILIKALNNMPDGLASHGEVLNACYDAYAMELGKMAMKSEYGTTRAYIPQLMDLYKQKHGLTFNEAQTDYSKRRQRERDVDAGRPVKPLPKNPQTDYAKKRAKEKRDLELFGEDTVQIPHKGKMVSGKVVRKDPVSGEYIVDVGEYGSVRVPAHKVKHGVEEEKTRLDPKCWKGKKIGNPKTKMKGGVRVNNCVPATEDIYMEDEPSPVESAIIRRIMVSHVDWLQKFGPEKVMQAAEEVAYNVGDVDEIGTSDVSAYVHEVGQILGAV